MAKRFFLILFILSVIFSFNIIASCDDLGFIVGEVIKSEDGSCFSEVAVAFQDIGCEYNCFQEVSYFLIMQGNDVKKNESGMYATYYQIDYDNKACDNRDISMVVIGKDGNEICRKNFILEEEFKEWEAYQAGNISYPGEDEYKAIVEETKKNTIESIKTQEIYDEKSKDSLLSGSDTGGSGAGGFGSATTSNEKDTIQKPLDTTSKNSNIIVKDSVYQESVSTISENIQSSNYPNENYKSSSFPIMKIALGVLGVIVILVFAGATHYILRNETKKPKPNSPKKSFKK